MAVRRVRAKRAATNPGALGGRCCLGDGVPAPDWTDFNRSDPGVTLLQLFVFLALALLFGLVNFLVKPVVKLRVGAEAMADVAVGGR